MNCCRHKYFVIYRGDDTDFPGNQELIVEINTTRDLTGCSAHFQFQGFTQDFAEIPSDKKLHLIFPSSETKKFALGASDAKLWLTNGTKIRTVESRIHIVVTNRVDEAYDNDDPQAITVTISGGGGGATVVLDDTVTEESPNGVKSSGIWSWVKSLLPQWLTSDYAEPATVASVKDKADQSALDSHVKNTNNPHAVTAAQVGALPLVEDKNDNKTAVTIGARDYLTEVGVYSLAIGNGVTASGYSSHAEGDLTIASGNYSHAEGSGTIASGYISHAAGYMAQTRNVDAYSFAWNGDRLRSDMYSSHGQGTFNINPVGGLGGFYIGEQTLAQVIAAAIAGKANLASLALEYSSTSAYSVGAIVYHDGSIYQCKTAIAEGGEAWNAEHWELRKLDDFFTESNSLLNATIAAKLPYPINTDGTILDRNVNVVTSGAFVIPEGFKDLLIRYTGVPASLTFSGADESIADRGDDLPTESGDYLITVTRIAASECYIRIIELKERA